MKALFLILLVFIPGFIFLYYTSNDILLSLLAFAFLLVIVLPWAYFLAAKRKKSTSVLFDSDQVTLQQHDRSVTIRRNEIDQIVEIKGGGLKITSVMPNTEIFAPVDLENYEHLKSALKSWTPITAKSDRQYAINVILAVLILGITIGAFVFKIKVLFFAFFGMMTAIVTYKILADSRGVIMDKVVRQNALISFLVFLSTTVILMLWLG